MADFKPRGAPNSQPQDPYAGWDLIHRNTMTPAGVYQKGDETAYGWAWPSMVTEPAQAIARLLNTPAGTMPDPQDPQNQKDALTGLMALYGGNALKGMAGARGAARVAATLGDMEAPRAVSYGNMIDDALSNPNMLRMMDDINYADLNRRALDDYGVGYEGLSSSQEARLRGWSDPGDVTFSSKNASIFSPPNRPQRAFEKDYPDVTGRHDAQERLTHDIDGNALNPNARVVGRRVVGGDDEALSPAEFNAITEALTGRSAQVAPASEMGRDAGRSILNKYTGDPLDVFLRSNLSEVQAPRVYAHEIGHVIDAHAAGLEGIPNTGILNKELKPVYNSLNNPNRQRLPGDDAAEWAKPVTPETFGYKGNDVPPEYMAEALRAYLTNPNYIKTVAPKTAARIRAYVNSNPRLNQTIQFNANTSPLAGWLASGANALAQPEDP